MNKENKMSIDNYVQISNKEGRLLYDLAERCKGKGVIVEIGSWKGKSTICLAKGTKAGNNLKVYAIDQQYATLKQFKYNINKEKVDDLIIPIVKTSKEAFTNFNKSIELVFIDGNHDYQFVKIDFRLWHSKLINGGIMAFHDTIAWNGVRKVVNKYICKSRYYKVIGLLDSIIYAVKVEQNSFFNRINNRFFLIIINIYYVMGKLKKLVIK